MQTTYLLSRSRKERFLAEILHISCDIEVCQGRRGLLGAALLGIGGISDPAHVGSPPNVFVLLYISVILLLVLLIAIIIVLLLLLSLLFILFSRKNAAVAGSMAFESTKKGHEKRSEAQLAIGSNQMPELPIRAISAAQGP